MARCKLAEHRRQRALTQKGPRGYSNLGSLAALYNQQSPLLNASSAFDLNSFGLGLSNSQGFGLGAVQLSNQIQNARFAECFGNPSKAGAESHPNDAVDNANVVLGSAWKDRLLCVFELIARQLRVLHSKCAHLVQKLLRGFRG